jgi:hypothetical protein
MHIPAIIAMKQAHENRFARKYPGKNDSRYRDDILFPSISPRFKISSDCTIFTIGSCFARNIEEKLSHRHSLPTMSFSVPKTEYQYRSNGLLNEYNPGTMYQRIIRALSGQSFGEDAIVEDGNGFGDLLLAGGPPVTLNRLIDRRKEIDNVYKSLISSEIVIITLGLVESWYDNTTHLYLNRMPPEKLIKNIPERYELHILNVEKTCKLMEEAVDKLIQHGIKKILLTVSPVPLSTTFSDVDSVTANSYSKSVLRVCADHLYRKYKEVDYFPSYEMVISKGHEAYIEDNIHVLDDIVEIVTQYMIDNYVAKN